MAHESLEPHPGAVPSRNTPHPLFLSHGGLSLKRSAYGKLKGTVWYDSFAKRAVQIMEVENAGGKDAEGKSAALEGYSYNISVPIRGNFTVCPRDTGIELTFTLYGSKRQFRTTIDPVAVRKSNLVFAIRPTTFDEMLARPPHISRPQDETILALWKIPAGYGTVDVHFALERIPEVAGAVASAASVSDSALLRRLVRKVAKLESRQKHLIKLVTTSMTVGLNTAEGLIYLRDAAVLVPNDRAMVHPIVHNSCSNYRYPCEPRIHPTIVLLEKIIVNSLLGAAGSLQWQEAIMLPGQLGFAEPLFTVQHHRGCRYVGLKEFATAELTRRYLSMETLFGNRQRVLDWQSFQYIQPPDYRTGDPLETIAYSVGHIVAIADALGDNARFIGTADALGCQLTVAASNGKTPAAMLAALHSNLSSSQCIHPNLEKVKKSIARARAELEQIERSYAEAPPPKNDRGEAAAKEAAMDSDSE